MTDSDELASSPAAARASSAPPATSAPPPASAPVNSVPPVGEDWVPKTMLVGIGASAGGLAALRGLFREMPPDLGVAYVVVVHLSPEHESHLADLLQIHCAMPVLQVGETVPVEADHVYVIPPGRNLSAIDSHLRLSPLEASRRERAPIDHFFRTLAETHGSQAVGIVLTGTGSDGTQGIKHIKERGGLTLVQDPNEAEYDGMPRSAIATGLIDRVLPITGMATQIRDYLNTQPAVTVPAEDEEVDADERALLHRLFALVRGETRRDFSRYKRSTVMRRIARRMQLHRTEALSAYLDLLDDDPNEVRMLADEFLITVTHFFRDEAVFTHLAEHVVPALFAGKKSTDAVRVWSVGCATGEEAYSLAMLLLEAADRMLDPPMVQVFASDLHEQSIQRAREGIYPDTIESDVSPERLERFFRPHDQGYRISKAVRSVVVFAPHNLLADPPFSRLNLITCRNLLIYLERAAQRDVIELFHYALSRDGYLLLGSSENIERADLFRTVEKRNCLYQRRDMPRPEVRLPVFPFGLPVRSASGPAVVHAPAPASFGALHQQIAEQHAPPSVLINDHDSVVHVSAQAHRYLEYPAGDVTHSLFHLVREPMRIELRAALHAVRETGKSCETNVVGVVVEGQPRSVVMRLKPALDVERRGFVLVIFDDTGHGTPGPAMVASGVQEAELTVLKERLNAVIAEFETSQEEMKAGNEELQSTNEELRSTMEELETSKEELQSMNEELSTLNQENRHKVEELSQLAGDLQNLLAATDVATLFLDRHLRILRFTPLVGRLFNMRGVDRGRPLSDLTHRLGYDSLSADARRVLTQLVPVEREVVDDEGRWYLTRVLPYRTADDRIEGVVITFIDITSRKEAEEALRASEGELATELAASRRLHRMMVDGVVADGWQEALDVILAAAVELQGADFGVIYLVSDVTGDLVEVAQRGFATTARAALAGVDQSALPCRRALRAARRVVIEDISVDHSAAMFRDAAVAAGFSAVHATPLARRGNEVFGVLCCYFRAPQPLAERSAQLLDLLARQAADLIDRLRAEERLRQAKETLEDRVHRRTAALHASEQRFRALVDASSQCVWTTDAHGKIVEDSPSWRAFTGQSFEAWRGEGWLDAVHADDRGEVFARWQDAVEHETAFDTEFRLHRHDDTWRWTHVRAVPLRDDEACLFGWVAMSIDIDDQKQAEQDREALMRALTIAEQGERRRLAQVLHDDLQQLLYAIEVKMKMARDALGARAPTSDPAGSAAASPAAAHSAAARAEADVELDEASVWLARAIQTTRQLAIGLSPPILEMEGLVDAIGWLQSQMAQLHGLTVRVEVDGSAPMPDADLRVLVFQAVRELLFNVIKHAGVTEATVTLASTEDEVVVAVADTGCGFVVAKTSERAKRTGHFGLNSIEERLRLIGGRLELHSRPGQGTRVVIHAPLRLGSR